jgi:BioD-like phosphotransacetylase family protein
VLAAFKSLKKKDFVILCGGGDFFDGSLLGLDTLSLSAALKAQVLVVEPWRGDDSVDALFGARTLLGERFAGGVLNKIPATMLDHIKGTVKPFLERKGVPVFGVIPRDKFLESTTVAQLNEILNGKVLCCEDKLDEFVENFHRSHGCGQRAQLFPQNAEQGCDHRRLTAPISSLPRWRPRPSASS